MRAIYPGHNFSEEIRGSNGNDEIHGKDGNDKLIGRGGNDKIWGDGDNDKLFGGFDHDQLTGGSGRDQFLFKELGAEHSDRIRDFTHGVDRIGLDTFVFTALSLGVVSEANFVQGTSAQDSDDFLIFDAETRKLYYDADGDGSGGQILLATIRFKGEEKTLTAEDLFVFTPQNAPE